MEEQNKDGVSVLRVLDSPTKIFGGLVFWKRPTFLFSVLGEGGLVSMAFS